MCGIFCEIFYSSESVVNDDNVMHRIYNRGPDCIHNLNINVGHGVKISFCGAVLWMQGPNVCKQPMENEEGILLFNGDIFDESWNKTCSDTQIIMEKLSKHKSDFSEPQVIEELKSLKGPFSLIYFNKKTHNLYFARDKLGRNTLLFHKSENSIVIGSVLGRKHKCVEVPATHILELNVKTKNVQLHPWSNRWQLRQINIDTWLDEVQKLQNLPDEEFTFDFDEIEYTREDDAMIKYIENVAEQTKCKFTLMKKLMEHSLIKEVVIQIQRLLEKSIKIRLETQPQKCKDCIHKSITCNHCTVGVLFSGGLDCTILAFLANKFLPKKQCIDLINVAFKKDSNASYDVPDRVTGRQSYEELRKLCPERTWIFREVNVEKEDLKKYQLSTIADLVHPRQTILDESLGSALWFAARSGENDSVSPCRVLLLGSGADELFGGYTRHRNAFKRLGWSGLAKELQMDWRRISFRNLARDNRVICDHGRQPRMPYLDEDFTDFVLNLKPWLKCFPMENMGQGLGDKLMLRLLAFHLGLTNVATFPKRALQFGSRIANKKEKGSDLSETFKNIQIY